MKAPEIPKKARAFLAMLEESGYPCVDIAYSAHKDSRTFSFIASRENPDVWGVYLDVDTMNPREMFLVYSIIRTACMITGEDVLPWDKWYSENAK